MSDDIQLLLELSAADDLEQFRSLVEQNGFDVDDSGLWYGRSIGSKKMKLEQRTPLMIASMFGSKQVLQFILGFNHVDVNKSCGSDRATAVHLAVAGGSNSSVEIIKLLINSSADTNCLDVHGNRPVDLIPFVFGSVFNYKRKLLEIMLNGYSNNKELHELNKLNELHVLSDTIDNQIEEQKVSNSIKKEYPVDLSLPDMNNGVYNTDEFRMYAFKIKPCSRAYSHDWTECPFVHPGENARRRDPRKYHYTCVPCPEFKKGSCRNGDNCEYAHGIFECWLHPAQYRTRLCKDEVGCTRKVCFFAHKPEELRPLNHSTGSAVVSPRTLLDLSSASPFSSGSLSVLLAPSNTPPVTPGGLSPRAGVVWSNQSTPTQKVYGSRFRAAFSNQDLDEFTRDNWGFSGDYFEENEISNRKSIEILASRNNQLHQNMNYSSGFSSSPMRNSSSSSSTLPFGVNSVMNSRSAAFAKRSQSFIDHGSVNRSSVSSSMMSSKLADWSSPDGKLNWGFQKDEVNKFRKSASFGVQRSPDSLSIANNQKHDVAFDEEQYFSPWLDHEQLVA